MVNEGVVMLNAELNVTKMNKSAEILLNTSSGVTVGKRITEILGANNNHLMKPITEVSQTKPYACLVKTQISVAKGASEAGQSSTQQQVNINFHVTKLANPEKKLHAVCLVI